ncbi:hypothetical protein AHAS_Ahas20G0114900 [Arachis hypogaea]
MKWLETINPKKEQQVDRFRVEYVSIVLFNEINQLKNKVIVESKAIRLSKPSAAISSDSSPFCKYSLGDIKSV